MSNNISPNKHFADALLSQMMLTAETYGWSGPSPEFLLWEQLSVKAPVLPDETIKQIKEKSEAAGGWWIWPNGFHSEGRFVSIAEWNAIRANHQLP